MSVFNLSAIDLFASAMGAFAIISLVLMPSYQMNAKIEVVVPVEDPPPDPIVLQGLIEAELGVIIQWEAPGVDIDLHILHADEMVYFKNKETAWMTLFEDEIKPSAKVSEVAAQTKLKPMINVGNYVVRVCYYNSSRPLSAPVNVDGLVVLKTEGQDAVTKTFELKVNVGDKWKRNKGIVAQRFRIKRVGTSYSIEFQD